MNLEEMELLLILAPIFLLLFLCILSLLVLYFYGNFLFDNKLLYLQEGILNLRSELIERVVLKFNI